MVKNKYDTQHDRNLAKYFKEIEDIYASACREAAQIGMTVGQLTADAIFAFKDFPITHDRIKTLMSKFCQQLEFAIVNGVESEWTLANNKNNALSQRVFGNNIGKLTKEQYSHYFNNHDKAREAFIQRQTAGLKLSDRVWNYTNQFQREIEMGLDVGIRSGRSADELSRDLRNYLKYPDKLFRRVRDEHGELQLSKAAQAFHSGRGVYRSSYKNARRLAATETNIAYRTADYLRYQDLDFVVGIKIVLSNNHPAVDICDDLSAERGSTNKTGRGCYPKTFKFTGWHPHCRCHVETILKTEEEIERDTERLLNGEEPVDNSENTINELPQAFQDWVKENQDRIENAKSLPYFISDNQQYVTSILSPNKVPQEYLGWTAFGKAKNAKETGEDLSDWEDELFEDERATDQIFRHRYVKEDWDTLVDDYLSTKMTDAEMEATGDDDPIETYVLEHGKNKDLDVALLRPTQPWVGEPMQWMLYRHLNMKGRVPIIHIEGTDRYYVVNGHHRTMNAILWGENSIETCVVEAPKSLLSKLSPNDEIDDIMLAKHRKK